MTAKTYTLEVRQLPEHFCQYLKRVSIVEVEDYLATSESFTDSTINDVPAESFAQFINAVARDLAAEVNNDLSIASTSHPHQKLLTFPVIVYMGLSVDDFDRGPQTDQQWWEVVVKAESRFFIELYDNHSDLAKQVGAKIF